MRALELTLPAVAAGALAFALTPLARRVALAVGAVDRPGARKVHREPTPRMGGVAIVAAAAAVFLLGAAGVPWLGDWGSQHLLGGVGLGLLPVLAVSVWDDVRPLRALPKLLAQLLGASLAVWCGIGLAEDIHLFGAPIHLGGAAAALSLVWIVGLTNAFNIVDGLDGLAAGLALISALGMSVVFYAAGNSSMTGAALVLGGAMAGFLPWNVHPARVFLGDSGSASIGFVLGCFALDGGSRLSAGFAALVPVFVMGLPVAETLVSIVRRLLRRKGEGVRGGVLEADRRHFHHRLLELGVGHRGSVLVLWGASLALGLLGLLSILTTFRQAGLLLVAIVVAAFVGIQRLGYEEFAVTRKGVILQLYDSPTLRGGLFVVFVDLIGVAAATWMAVGLKWDEWGLGPYRAVALGMAAVLSATTVVVHLVLGVYRRAWRLAGLDDFVRLGLGVAVATFLGAVLDAVFVGGRTPISLFAIYGFVNACLSAASRGSFRLLRVASNMGERGAPTVVYGAGRAGAAAVRELRENEKMGLSVIGFVDDDPGKEGRYVVGLPVLGPLETLDVLAEAHQGLTVLVSTRKVGGERLRAAARACRKLGIRMVQMEFGFRELMPSRAPETAAPSPVSPVSP